VKIDHIAIWVTDLERMRDFYLKYFNTTCGELYNNPIKRFNSYFITFYDGNSRIELMTRPDIVDYNIDPGLGKGYTHLAIAVGDRMMVDKMVSLLRIDGYSIIGKPRVTGDGYYEAVALDPENNIVELVAEKALSHEHN
jgi:lactoylglutathione lyase